MTTACHAAGGTVRRLPDVLQGFCHLIPLFWAYGTRFPVA